MEKQNMKKTCTDEGGRTFTEGQAVWFRGHGETCRGTIREICPDGTIMVSGTFEEARLCAEEVFENKADAE